MKSQCSGIVLNTSSISCYYRALRKDRNIFFCNYFSKTFRWNPVSILFFSIMSFLAAS